MGDSNLQTWKRNIAIEIKNIDIETVFTEWWELKKLSVKSLLRVKANLLHKTEKTIEHGFHRDFPYENNTAIFYLNTNNGYTKFKNKKIIKSEKNKLVDFNSSLEHTGSTCTDEDYRIVINFNYF
jgi:hypothetical protein